MIIMFIMVIMFHCNDYNGYNDYNPLIPSDNYNDYNVPLIPLPCEKVASSSSYCPSTSMMWHLHFHDVVGFYHLQEKLDGDPKGPLGKIADPSRISWCFDHQISPWKLPWKPGFQKKRFVEIETYFWRSLVSKKKSTNLQNENWQERIRFEVSLRTCRDSNKSQAWTRTWATLWGPDFTRGKPQPQPENPANPPSHPTTALNDPPGAGCATNHSSDPWVVHI